MILLTAAIAAPAQDDLYPLDSFYGGGVGFSQMYFFTNVGKLAGFELLGSVTDSVTQGSEQVAVTRGLGLNPDDFSAPFIVNGGEGFSHITGRWRLGGYAGVGSSQISGKSPISLFLDLNENGEHDGESTELLYDYTGIHAPDLQAKISLWIGSGMVEYVFPIFAGLEVSAGTMIGVGRAVVSMGQTSGSPRWEDQFTNVVEPVEDGLVAIGDLDSDDDVDADDIALAQEDLRFSTVSETGMQASLSGAFTLFQPYTAVKLQFLDRVGLRISFGFNLGKVGAGQWVLNNKSTVSDSPEVAFNAPAIRAMLYFGL